MKLVNPFSGSQLLRLGVVAALGTGVLATVAGHGTLAFFTTQVTSTGNVFTAGTLHLKVADVDQGASLTSVASSITFANMKPGDVVYAPLEIDNTGSLDAVYGIKYATTSTFQDLAPALKLAINATGAAGTGTTATVVADATTACSDATFADTNVWADSVRSAAFMVAGAGQTIQAVSSATNVPAAAVGRPLVATSGTETLCLEITFFEGGSSNTYNNATDGHANTTVTFTFDGLVAAAPTTANP